MRSLYVCFTKCTNMIYGLFVCVCLRERERDREKRKKFHFSLEKKFVFSVLSNPWLQMIHPVNFFFVVPFREGKILEYDGL